VRLIFRSIAAHLACTCICNKKISNWCISRVKVTSTRNGARDGGHQDSRFLGCGRRLGNSAHYSQSGNRYPKNIAPKHSAHPLRPTRLSGFADASVRPTVHCYSLCAGYPICWGYCPASSGY
jgi:hypothetical protein